MSNNRRNNVFEMFGHHVSNARRAGIVLPLAYAEMITEKGTLEGEIALAVMSDGVRRVGFYMLKNDHFIDVEFKPDPDVQGNIMIERSTKGRRVREDEDIEFILTESFEPSSQLKQITGSSEVMSTLQLARYAQKLMQKARYSRTMRKKGREVKYTSAV